MTTTLIPTRAQSRPQPYETRGRIGAPTALQLAAEQFARPRRRLDGTTLEGYRERQERTSVIPKWEHDPCADVRTVITNKPDWRYRLSLQFAAEHARPEDIQYDRRLDALLMQQAVPFFHEHTKEISTRAGERNLRLKYPHKMNAWDIYNKSEASRWLIEALVMTGMSREAMGIELRLDPMDIYWYECFFFDLRSCLDSPLEVVERTFHRLHAEGKVGDPADYLLKMIGWACGAEDVIMSVDPRNDITAKVNDLLVSSFTRDIKIDSTIAALKRRPRFDNEGEIIDGYFKMAELQRDSGTGGIDSQAYLSTLMMSIGTSMAVKVMGSHNKNGVEARANEDMAKIWEQRNEARRLTLTTGGSE